MIFTVSDFPEGLATVGYELLAADLTTILAARTTAGVVEMGGGNYAVSDASPPAPPFLVKWDSGEATPAYAFVPVNPSLLDLTQALDSANGGDSVGGALLAARAEGFGKWSIAGTPGTAGCTLRLYAADGTTVVRTFDLSVAGSRL